MKSRITEQKNARGKLAYKSVEDVDRAIAQLQKQVDSGTMKIVDEKKALSEISQLNRQKKSFGGIDDGEKGIADVKAQIAELKKTMDDPEARAMSEKYNAIQKELDDIKAEQDVVYKNINQLRDQRTKAQNEQQEAWQALKAHKDDFFARKRAAREYENKAYQIRKEKQATEQQAYLAAKRKANAEQKLEEASAPAFQDEILTAEGLIRYFDPSAVAAKEVAAPSKFAATSGRTVNDEAFKGMKAVKKDDQEDFFIGGGGKKKKGGKKGAAAGTSTPAETTGKFNLNLGVLEDLAKVKVDAPSSQADVPKVVEALKEKVSKWKADQDKQTKEVSFVMLKHVSYILIQYRTLPRHRRRSTVSRLRRPPTRANTDRSTSPRSPLQRTPVSMERSQPRPNLHKRKMASLTLRQIWPQPRSRTTSKTRPSAAMGSGIGR